ncbi:Extracellular metalloproteinase 4 [Pseudohyphozyma bogoriensis]|nr:Extracellular metalloproteinase 4 [Pseudohyphozyma bogoriensis]
MRTHQRRTRVSALSLSTLSLASLASAIVIPNGKLPGVVGASTPRKSINFGPHTPSGHHSSSNPSPALSLYNSQAGLLSASARAACVDDDDLATCTGRGIAHDFLTVLHPTAEFQLVDGYTTKHLNVFHGYFVQVVDGVPVANGNVNVNVDLDSSEILSYGDSSFARSASVGSQLEGWKAKVASWASDAAADATQMVLGGSAATSDDRGDLEEFSSPPLVPSDLAHSSTKDVQADPRHGLVTFLAMQAPHDGLTKMFVSTPRTSLIDQLSVRAVDNTPNSFVIHDVPSAVEPVKASLAWVHDGANLKLAWKYEVQTLDNHYEAYVDAKEGVSGDEETLMVVDWVRDFRPTGGEVGFESLYVQGATREERHGRKYGLTRGGKPFKTASADQVVLGEVDQSDASAMAAFKSAKPSYKVFPWGINAPDEGKRELLKGSLIELDNEASPVGWHTIPPFYKGGSPKHYTTTRGNNVHAQDNPDGGNSYEYNYRPDAGSNLTFDFPLGWPKAGTPLEPHTYINASVTELFYTNNEIHDLFYRYGFDEISGNFQDNNFERGGLGNDAVQANAQDGSGMNNANFATPPDGSRPRMRMYSWSGAQPYRDGDFEAGIVIHEYAHGISTRLTGGPANSGCLGWGEAGGMGEGWGDFFSVLVRQHNLNETEFSMGEWASARTNGIRNYKYSRNMTVNPSTYNYLDKSGYWGVHAIGEVWAEFLFEVAELFEDKHGISKSLFPPPANSTAESDFYSDKYANKKVPKSGNTLMLQLVVDAMKLQPCRPSFQDARDAIILADKKLTGGDNECIIWKGFSLRGLGPDSKVVGSTPWGGGVRTNDFNLPLKCSKSKKPKALR